MYDAASPKPPAPPPHRFDLLAGLMSYIVPGLGQIYQGRLGKGLLFLVCLYGLFFYGMHLGSWQNVYIPDMARHNPGGNQGPTVLINVWNRLQFAGQFWIGAAAWPAILQYNKIPVPLRPDFQKAPDVDVLNDLQRDGDKTWDLGWVYTVIAGVLNILVIYDALAGPAFGLGATASSTRNAPAVKEAVA